MNEFPRASARGVILNLTRLQMIRFKLSRGVIYGGGKCGKAGEVVDLSETDAQVLTIAKAGEVYEGESRAPESESIPEVPKKKGKK